MAVRLRGREALFGSFCRRESGEPSLLGLRVGNLIGIASEVLCVVWLRYCFRVQTDSDKALLALC